MQPYCLYPSLFPSSSIKFTFITHTYNKQSSCIPVSDNNFLSDFAKKNSFLNFYLFIYGCAVSESLLGLSLAVTDGVLSSVVHRLLIVVASLVVEYRF